MCVHIFTFSSCSWTGVLTVSLSIPSVSLKRPYIRHCQHSAVCRACCLLTGSQSHGRRVRRQSMRCRVSQLLLCSHSPYRPLPAEPKHQLISSYAYFYCLSNSAYHATVNIGKPTFEMHLFNDGHWPTSRNYHFRSRRYIVSLVLDYLIIGRQTNYRPSQPPNPMEIDVPG
jgi:hypothetical protein